MAQDLTVGSNTYQVPTNNEDPGWGEELAAWMKAVTDTLTTVSGTYDVSTTTFSIGDNKVVGGDGPVDITGLSFNSTAVRSFNVFYTAYRTTDTNSVTAYADGGSGQVVATCASHGLTEGSTVTISGSTNYNGNFVISNVTANTFEITDTWVADDAAGTYVVYSREAGQISVVYDGLTTWNFSVRRVGDAGLDFMVTSAGQVQYYTSNMGGSNYVGNIKFTAETIAV